MDKMVNKTIPTLSVSQKSKVKVIAIKNSLILKVIKISK